MQLAQYNIARLKAPPAELPDFLEEVKRVNEIGDAHPGFVWRYEVSDGNSLEETVRDGKIINLTVWETPQTLWDFTFMGAHLQMLRRRKDWFVPGEMTNILWWVDDGHRPTVAEAEERMDHFLKRGATAEAFTWKEIRTWRTLS